MEVNHKGFKLSHHNWNRRYFDANDPDDLAEYRYFLQNSRWNNTCPFIVEWPFTNVLEMIHRKIVSAHIDLLINKTRKDSHGQNRR